MVTEISHHDLIIAGGGLAGGLIALAVAQQRPEIRLLLIESEGQPGGNHVWSFFDGDVSREHRPLIEPMIAWRWEGGHDVRFPGYSRTLKAPYNSMTSDAFAAHLHATLCKRLMTGAYIADLRPEGVTLDDGRHFTADGVIDARGGADLSAFDCGWQKFVGQELHLSTPHGMRRPTIMDATVPQGDGYRFVYLLPTGERTIFVEDTYYSTDPVIDAEMLRHRIANYAADQFWKVETVEREEQGCLPVLMGGDFEHFWPGDDPLPRAGARAAMFNPTTGYSLPDAVRFAHHVAGLSNLDSAVLARESRAWAARLWKERGYFRLLDTMLFRAAEPSQRWRIFARFYHLAEPLIGRFYASGLTLSDRIRILSGRPPVPIRGALRAIMQQREQQ